MGVCTTAYSIPPEMIREIRVNPNKLENLLGVSDKHNPEWKVKDYSFETDWEETVKTLNQGGFKRAWEKLNSENYLNYDGFNVWTVTPSAIKSAAKDLEMVSLAEEFSDYFNKISSECSYLENIEEMKEFFKKTAEEGNYLLFATS